MTTGVFLNFIRQLIGSYYFPPESNFKAVYPEPGKPAPKLLNLT
jgi:hypothetical protein